MGEYHKRNREQRKQVTDHYLQCSSIYIKFKRGKTGQWIRLFRNTFEVGKMISEKTSNKIQNSGYLWGSFLACVAITNYH